MEFLQHSATAIITSTLLPGPANAAKYGGFGVGSPEVIDPKDAIVDTDILKSDSVQKGLAAVRAYKHGFKCDQCRPRRGYAARY